MTAGSVYECPQCGVRCVRLEGWSVVPMQDTGSPLLWEHIAAMVCGTTDSPSTIAVRYEVDEFGVVERLAAQGMTRDDDGRWLVAGAAA